MNTALLPVYAEPPFAAGPKKIAESQAHRSANSTADQLDETGPTATPDENMGLVARVSATIKRVATVSELVRITGVGAVILSMFMFLVEGVDIANDQHRFYTILLFTGLLGGAGLALGWLLKEYRGARAFFGLALVSVPVNFAVLGALAYSLFGLDATATDYPTVALWTVGSAGSLAMTSVIALLTLIPVTFMAFTVMARQSRNWLTPALIASSALLMIPLRQSEWIVPLVAAVTLGLLWLVRRQATGVIPLKTATGKFSLALLFLPPVIMLVRSIWLYQIDLLAGLIVVVTAYIVVRQISQRTGDTPFLQNLLNLIGVGLGITGALLVDLAIAPLLPSATGGGVFALVTTLVLFDLYQRIAHPVFQRLISLSGTALVVLSSLFSMMLVDTAMTLTLTLVTGALLLYFAIRNRLTLESACAMGLVVAALVLQLDQLLWIFTSAGWWGIACGGATAIVLASLLERHGATVALRCKHWFSQTQPQPLSGGE
ncbi:MAG: hypothetical protein KTR33_01420 [Gammaproteobacteria bacterium]|nr:hypothetical protein [Gammaproteobacteria bacterium]